MELFFLSEKPEVSFNNSQVVDNLWNRLEGGIVLLLQQAFILYVGFYLSVAMLWEW